MIFALVGNQNCGKTSLFNVLTGSNQHVGNFPGVTVDQKIGEMINCKNCQMVDLPGIYSIRPYSSEEIVTRDFILNNNPDCIVNIIDAMNIERNLYLTLQLLELGKPLVIALNMMDEIRANGGSINVELLSKLLGVTVIPISVIKQEGIQDLKDAIIETGKKHITPKVYDFCSPGPVHRCIHAVTHIVEDHAQQMHISRRFLAMAVILKDESLIEQAELDKNELRTIDHHIKEMEDERGLDVEAAIADMRYDFIDNCCSQTVSKPQESKQRILSEKIDKILTNKYLAIPIFVLIMGTIFYLTFNVVGAFLSDIFALVIDAFTGLVDTALSAYQINPVVHSLIIDGVFAGVGSVLAFLPIVVTLFFFLSILEDTGYMARVAFVMDKLLRKIGLSGKSIVPMLIGFGCSVPAVMSTRTLTSERDRKMTIMLIPFFSCSAKIPVYAVFTAAFFPKYQALVMIILYVLGIIIAVIAALVLNNTAYKGKPIPFILELPNYRIPSIKTVLQLMWDKAKDFLQKAFTVIFVITVVIWVLQNFDIRLNHVSDASLSMLAMIGKIIAPIFTPLGFNDWRVATALLTGFSAKEAVIGTLAILINTSEANLPGQITGLFTLASASAFLVFTLLYTPCIAAVNAIKKEIKSWPATILIVILQCLVAWVCGWLVFTIGSLL